MPFSAILQLWPETCSANFSFQAAFCRPSLFLFLLRLFFLLFLFMLLLVLEPTTNLATSGVFFGKRHSRQSVKVTGDVFGGECVARASYLNDCLISIVIRKGFASGCESANGFLRMAVACYSGQCIGKLNYDSQANQPAYAIPNDIMHTLIVYKGRGFWVCFVDLCVCVA